MTAVMSRTGGEPQETSPQGEEPAAIGAPTAPAASAKKPRAKIVLVTVAVVLGGAFTTMWATGRGKQSTDDAFVESHVASVAARIQGQVLRVHVKDNQEVDVGTVLVELDDRDARVRVATSEADLLSARANLAAMQTQLALTEKNVDANLRQAQGGIVSASALAGSSRAGIDQAKADVVAAESRRTLARIDLERSQRLHADGAVPQADLDAKKALFDQAEASLAQARAREQSALTSVTNAVGTIESARGRLAAAQAGPEQVEAARAAVAVAQARVAQAEAAVEQAKLTLSYTQIKAQTKGVVSRRSVEVGQTVDPARPLMAITSLDDVWVVANFKEDQIANIHVGQPVTVKIDAFAGRTLRAHVDSLSGGSGARFSLLPPDNASGNFTKVVQRIPVLVRFDDKPADLVLRPGMSSYVTVKTN